MCNGKSDEDFSKLKLCRYPTSITSDLYEFKISLFDHVMETQCKYLTMTQGNELLKILQRFKELFNGTLSTCKI